MILDEIGVHCQICYKSRWKGQPVLVKCAEWWLDEKRMANYCQICSKLWLDEMKWVAIIKFSIGNESRW